MAADQFPVCHGKIDLEWVRTMQRILCGERIWVRTRESDPAKENCPWLAVLQVNV